jgi:tetratricopeptide (TPR) repeat protein
LIWLGEGHLGEGRPEAAEPLFAKALSLQPRSVAALYGLGRAALAMERYGDAVKHLERALALDKAAAAVHYPLAMAYRGLGDASKADTHLRQRSNAQLQPADPLMQELKDALQTPMAYELRGARALNSRNWSAAVSEFRQGLERAPDNPSLRHKLGTALVLMGDTRAARGEFERVIRTSPEYAKAHYSLGVLDESDGRLAEALNRYTAAVHYDPSYVEARVRLAGLERRSGRLHDSLQNYQRVLEINPRVPEALFGYAMALVRLGRYGEALTALNDAARIYPDQVGFAHARARLLAAAPDDRIRDGKLAMSIMQALPDEQRRADLGETMAMTLAEVGQYEEAAAWQRNAIAAARQAGQSALAQRMAGHLRLYESHKPCRTPWRDQDLP